MKRFGLPWGAPICEDLEVAETPVGEKCQWCDEPILPTDSGVLILLISKEGGGLKPWHWECHTRSVVGGINHLNGNCFCCGGNQPPDPPEISRRESAKRAVEGFEKQNRFMRQVNRAVPAFDRERET